ncbi:MAG: hypothetical protein ACYTFZ_10270 [Planctomycetota bacterium]|jgi:hypothetical protein
MAFNTVTIVGTPVHKEATGSGAITPGMLIELTTAGAVKVHATSGGDAQRMFALEDDLQGNDLNHAYEDGELVQYGVFNRGDEVNALLADGENASISSKLKSNGDGYLAVYTAASGEPDYPESIVAIAKEALDMSGSSGADPASQRIRVEII